MFAAMVLRPTGCEGQRCAWAACWGSEHRCYNRDSLRGSAGVNMGHIARGVDEDHVGI